MTAFFRLVRFPAVFTVLADCAMGFLFTCRTPGQTEWGVFALICAASVALYWFGMAFNDIVDVERDSLHPVRCFRPIPSGALSLANAKRIALVLLLLGTVIGCITGILFATNWLISIASLAGLIISIILYDGAFKSFWFAPLIMGLCRAFNILFAMSVYYNPQNASAAGIALVLTAYTVYITGVTWFARYENAEEDNAWQTEDETASPIQRAVKAPWTPSAWLSALVIGLGIFILFPLADVIPAQWQYPIFAQDPIRWRMLIGVLSLMVAFRALQTLLLNKPQAIGPIVGYCLTTLIVLDAIVVCLIHSPTAAICIVCLLIPTIVLNKITYIT